MHKTNDIAYQNKDIASKIFAEKFKGKSLQVYGIDLPRIKQVLPTNFPDIRANELRLDNLFLLEDDTFLIIDYESAYKPKNKIKYLNYVSKVLETYCDDYGLDLQISVVVIYTADVLQRQTKNSLDAGSVKLKITEAFLSEMDSDKVKRELTDKVHEGKKLSDEELMQYIILPLTYQGMDQKKNAISELFELAKDIEEEDTQLFLLAGILVFTDKVIDDNIAKCIKEWIRMTKIAKLFELEKEEAVKETAKATAIELLKDGISVDLIVKYVKNLSINEVEQLKKEL